jgi:two-component system, cell cycle sensor histidine kinase PleC
VPISQLLATIPASHESNAPQSLPEALDALRIAIVILDAEERLIYANAHYSYLFRSLPPREELIGITYEELIRKEAAGNELADPMVAEDIDGFVALRRGQLKRDDYRPRYISRADGRILEVKARPTKDGGWILLWSDVSETQRTLIRLRNAIALTADAFAFYDRDDKLVLCNDEFATISGFASGEMVGRIFESLLSAEDAGKYIKNGADAAKWIAERKRIHREPAGAITFEMADGTVYLLRDRATEDGGRVAVFTDITEKARAESALAEQSRALDKAQHALARSKEESSRQSAYLADMAVKLDHTAQEADATKKTLLRTMSHELKTPLNAIIGFSDLMLASAEQLSPEQVAEYSGLIHRGGQNLLRLLNQILDLTKISAGRYDLRLANLDADSSLWQAKEAVNDKAAARNIAVTMDGKGPGPFVLADDNALSIMLSQLIENAVSFTQEGGKVHLSIGAPEGGMVEIRVADNGPGVAAADIERILEPFEQAGRSHAEHTDGAGLGLTLVKALAELHEGSLVVESTPGQGFTARLRLPQIK